MTCSSRSTTLTRAVSSCRAQILLGRCEADDSLSRTKDINPGWESSDPRNFVSIGAVTYFTAHVSGIGEQLWKTDGTGPGTVLVKQIGDYPSLGELTPMGTMLFFRACPAYAPCNLWKSDGTEIGTVPITDIGTNERGPDYLTAVNDRLFFRRAGANLWRSDGTQAGTVLVKDFTYGIRGFANVNGTLFFAGSGGPPGSALWKSDGTPEGTVRVKTFDGPSYYDPSSLTVLGQFVLFGVDDGLHGRELWRSDGTEAGTILVKDIFPGVTDSLPPNDCFGPPCGSDLTRVGDRVFFPVSSGSARQLWKSDGTTAGTMLVRDFSFVVGGGAGDLTDVDGTLFFVDNDGIHGPEIWKSDGTNAGTMLVKDIFPGSDLYYSGPSYLTAVNGLLFFSAADRSTPPAFPDYELWESNGTEPGTRLVKRISVYDRGSFPLNLTNADGTVLFAADDGLLGNELWAFRPSGSEPVCVGDCGVDGEVTTDELLVGVDIALGNATLQVCAPLDANDDGVITVDELLSATNGSVTQCK